MSKPESAAPLLVAVDASLESLAALDWAIEFASTRGHALRVVTAATPRFGPTSDSAGSYHTTTNDTEDRARKRVRSLILGPLKRSGLQFEHIVAVGSIDRVMARHSTDAALAVVGTRQPTGWRRLVHRSTTKRLTGRLACPLVSITVPSARAFRKAQPALAAPAIATHGTDELVSA